MIYILMDSSSKKETVIVKYYEDYYENNDGLVVKLITNLIDYNDLMQVDNGLTIDEVIILGVEYLYKNDPEFIREELIILRDLYNQFKDSYDKSAKFKSTRLNDFTWKEAGVERVCELIY